MKVRRFVAATSREALRQVREALGGDAVILANRGTPGGIEILAAASEEVVHLAMSPHAKTSESQSIAAPRVKLAPIAPIVKPEPAQRVPTRWTHHEGNYGSKRGRVNEFIETSQPRRALTGSTVCRNHGY